MMKKEFTHPLFKTTLLIFLSFFLTSTGHLSWMYHLMTLVSAGTSDLLTVTVSYLLQAVGIGVFALIQHRFHPDERKLLFLSLIAYAVCLVPASVGTSVAVTVTAGLLMSLLCGVIAGVYLYALSAKVGISRRATSFGVGYGLTTVVSWLLSLIGSGSFYYGKWVLLICAVTAILAALCAFIPDKSVNAEAPPDENVYPLPRLLVLCGAVVLLFSLVNNIGFSYATSALQDGMRLEFSRLFYAIGLICAGLINDKSRKYGAVCALAALILPFIIPTLRGEALSVQVFWSLEYFAFGFYAVYRVILFSDIAAERNLFYLSGAGLLIGRIGDALGAQINFLLDGNAIVSIITAAIIFAFSIFVFIKLYPLRYLPSSIQPKSEKEIFESFAVSHDLSVREREVLRLVLDNQSNKEIADEINISESTVKFHVHNLLQKTGCKNRTDLRSAYHASRG